MEIDFNKIDWVKVSGKVPAIVQNYKNNEFLMLGYQDKDAIIKTLNEGVLTFFSRTKKRLWTKGETSGNYLKVIDIKIDCDGDSLLYKVLPTGNTCHLGKKTCFDKEFNLFELEKVIEKRKKSNSEKSYTLELLNGNEDKLYRKVTEEATEVLLAAKNGDKNNLKNEIADLFFHVLVTMKKQNLSLKSIYEELLQRNKNNISYK